MSDLNAESARRWVHPADFDGALAQRNALRLRVEDLTRENDWLWAALRDTYGDLQQLVPGFSKPYVEAKLAAQSDGSDG